MDGHTLPVLVATHPLPAGRATAWLPLTPLVAPPDGPQQMADWWTKIEYVMVAWLTGDVGPDRFDPAHVTWQVHLMDEDRYPYGHGIYRDGGTLDLDALR